MVGLLGEVKNIVDKCLPEGMNLTKSSLICLNEYGSGEESDFLLSSCSDNIEFVRQIVHECNQILAAQNKSQITRPIVTQALQVGLALAPYEWTPLDW